MVALGLTYALLSGIANGLFSTPMKLIPRWKWENIWLVFILIACVAMPLVMVLSTGKDVAAVIHASPTGALTAAIVFGFGWGFGAILYGLTVDRLGVSLANSMVIGLSSALGSIVPLLVKGTFQLEMRQLILMLGVATFLLGVWICGKAGKLREGCDPKTGSNRALLTGLVFSVGAGVMSAIFNVGYSLALPIADSGQRLGFSSFQATNCIWLLMLGAGSIPNIVFCSYLLKKNRSVVLFTDSRIHKTWGLALVMGLLWGASIFLYGAATPLLGDIGPSIGWPISLTVSLIVANFMGLLLGEWRQAPLEAQRLMRWGILTLLVAVVLTALSAKAGS
jgi:L-rhamnose-H+ transport protein